MEVPCEPFLYDSPSFCFFLLTCSSFFCLFWTRTWTWTWTYWHTGSPIQLDTVSLTHYLTSGDTNDSDARAVGVLTLHRADFQRVLAQRAIPPARPHFGKRLVDYVCVPLFLLFLLFCF